MKNLMLLVCLVCAAPCLAEKSLMQSSINWIVDSLPDNTTFSYDSDSIRFKGCKQREYQMLFEHNLSQNISVEAALGYSKAKLHWGVFSQKVSVYQTSIIPRYEFNQKLSLGVGVIAQSTVAFKTTQGETFTLPRSTEWLAAARIKGLAAKHYWEVKVSSQKWQASNVSSENWFERGMADNKINLLYQGAF